MSCYCCPEAGVSRSAMARNSSGAPWRRVFYRNPVYSNIPNCDPSRGWGGVIALRARHTGDVACRDLWAGEALHRDSRVVPWCIAAARVWWHSYAFAGMRDRVQGWEGRGMGEERGEACAHSRVHVRDHIPGTYIPRDQVKSNAPSRDTRAAARNRSRWWKSAAAPRSLRAYNVLFIVISFHDTLPRYAVPPSLPFLSLHAIS